MHLKLTFATAAHEGSVRCIDVAGAPDVDDNKKKKKKRQRSESIDDDDDESRPSSHAPGPGSLLSGGYDEAVNVFDLRKRVQVGELKTQGDLGSPLCCSFAPPSRSSSSSQQQQPTHALVGTTSGKIVLYKKRDWSVQHVLSGHDGGGAGCIAVHPTGRMALSGGRDGKINLWDLVKGRLAYVHKLPRIARGARGGGGVGRQKETVEHIVWSDDGARYAYCHGTRITARDAASGEDLLDVDAPARANQLAFVGGPEGMFLAAACDDGGLPVFEVGRLLDESTDAEDTRRAIMAIEPADGVAAGDDRLKCIRSVEGGSGFLAVTANSGGVVSLMDLEGAARMMLTEGGGGDEDEDGGRGSSDGSDDEDDESVDSDEEVEAAVEILDSVRIGSGARITDLAVWSHGGEGGAAADFDDIPEDESGDEAGSHPVDDSGGVEDEPPVATEERPPTKKGMKKEYENRRGRPSNNTIELDAEEVEKARKLVGQAKKRQKKEKKRKKKKEDQTTK